MEEMIYQWVPEGGRVKELSGIAKILYTGIPGITWKMSDQFSGLKNIQKKLDIQLKPELSWKIISPFHLVSKFTVQRFVHTL